LFLTIELLVSRLFDLAEIDFVSGEVRMTEEKIAQWMYEKVKKDGFTNATSLAESFLQEHRITDVLDPDFSLTLDVGFKVAQEIKDQRIASVSS
jgi:hypothetical protein